MEKNRLLLNHKRYLSFLNYKNILKKNLNNPNDFKFIFDTNSPKSNLIMRNESIKKREQKNKNNVPLLLHKNNKSVKFFSVKRIIQNINIKKEVQLKDEYKLNPKFININRIKKNNDEENKENYNNNNKFLNRRCNKYLDDKKFNRYNKFRYSMDCSARDIGSGLYLSENKKEANNDFNKIIKNNKVRLSSRKLNKNAFGKGIYKMIKGFKGKKNIKLKIIGALRTEPNYN